MPAIIYNRRKFAKLFLAKTPENPKTFGDHLRKAMIDAGLLIYPPMEGLPCLWRIKDLARKLVVTEDSVINWEVRGRMPRPREADEDIFQH